MPRNPPTLGGNGDNGAYTNFPYVGAEAEKKARKEKIPNCYSRFLMVLFFFSPSKEKAAKEAVLQFDYWPAAGLAFRGGQRYFAFSRDWNVAFSSIGGDDDVGSGGGVAVGKKEALTRAQNAKRGIVSFGCASRTHVLLSSPLFHPPGGDDASQICRGNDALRDCVCARHPLSLSFLLCSIQPFGVLFFGSSAAVCVCARRK